MLILLKMSGGYIFIQIVNIEKLQHVVFDGF